MNIPTINTPPQETPPQPPRQNNFMGLLGIFLVAMGCLILVCVVGAGYLVLRTVITSTSLTPAPTPEISEEKVTPSAPSTQATSVQATLVIPQVVDLTGAMETLKSLGQTVVPVGDPLELAKRFQGKTGIAATATGTPPGYKTGDQLSFWIVNGDTDKNSQVQAKLAYTTPHLYFWIQNGVNYKENDLKTLCETFESKIYPTDREFFGSEWSPGVDNDVHLFILFTRGLGRTTAGYFSSGDEVPPAAYPYSNGHEMFVMNADSFTNLADSYIYSVLAHEFQHMIHWYRDRNEEGWMNEGFSELAAFLNGYGIGGFDNLFAAKPDLQLNDWPNDKNATAPHYGASFLFLDYFLNRFGEKATQAVVNNPANGFDSIDQVLADQKAQDPTSHQLVTADDLFADWSLTNYIKDKSVGDGRFTYANYAQAPKVKDTETIRTCPITDQARTVNQYAADYIRITCRGNYTLSFKGSREVGVLPADAHSGSYAFWSNKGDDSDMSLSQTFDFSKVSGSVSLSYWTWYDLEEHYDFIYLVASTDGGNTWQIIKTPGGTDDNISGNNFGWGYNAASGGWIQQKVDLSPYAGKKVTLRFDYITDPAVNGEGLLLDDVEIPQINYQSDFEKDNGGWDAAGFVRIQNRLPQTFRVSLIQAGQVITVQYLTVNPDETASLPLNLTSDVVLVVSGTTRYTRLPAKYTFSLKP
jgi:immune inhibitor A